MTDKKKTAISVLLWCLVLAIVVFWLFSNRTSMITRKNYGMPESEFAQNPAFSLTEKEMQKVLPNENNLFSYLKQCAVPGGLTWKTSYQGQDGVYSFTYRTLDGKIRLDCQQQKNFVFTYIFDTNRVIYISSTASYRQVFQNDGSYHPLVLMHLPTLEELQTKAVKAISHSVENNRSVITVQFEDCTVSFDSVTGLPLSFAVAGQTVSKTEEIGISKQEPGLFE